MMASGLKEKNKVLEKNSLKIISLCTKETGKMVWLMERV